MKNVHWGCFDHDMPSSMLEAFSVCTWEESSGDSLFYGINWNIARCGTLMYFVCAPKWRLTVTRTRRGDGQRTSRGGPASARRAPYNRRSTFTRNRRKNIAKPSILRSSVTRTYISPATISPTTATLFRWTGEGVVFLLHGSPSLVRYAENEKENHVVTLNGYAIGIMIKGHPNFA